jgi:hypothetical protein
MHTGRTTGARTLRCRAAPEPDRRAAAACFAALLGEPKHGRWLIGPVEPDARVERRYLDGSMILATTFETRALLAQACGHTSSKLAP